MSASAGLRQDEVTEGRRAELRFCVYMYLGGWSEFACQRDISFSLIFAPRARARARAPAGAAACSNAFFSWTFPTSCDPGLVSGGASQRTCKWRNPRLVKHEF